VTLDRLDVALLGLLQRNGRLTAAELSEKVGLSPSGCHRRIKALEDAGVIASYVALLSDQALGGCSIAYVAVTLDNQRAETQAKFERAAATHAEIMECTLMTGESDYLLKVAVPSGDSYDRIHREILSLLPGAQRLVSQFAIRTVWSRTAVPLRLQ
jgi:Lrp/AsnC family transcriptional regulator, leucine-responsive regulatory protein